MNNFLDHSLILIILSHMAGFMGVWTAQWHSIPCSDRPSVFHFMLCSCHLKILNMFSLNLCFVNEVWKTLEHVPWSLPFTRGLPAVSFLRPGSRLSIAWCSESSPASPSTSALLTVTTATLDPGWSPGCVCDGVKGRPMFCYDPLPPVGPWTQAWEGWSCHMHLEDAFWQSLGDGSSSY